MNRRSQGVGTEIASNPYATHAIILGNPAPEVLSGLSLAFLRQSHIGLVRCTKIFETFDGFLRQ